MVSVDPAAVRREATRWIKLADDLAKVRSAVEGRLSLGPSAFFIGNFTEIVHYPAYRDFHDRMVHRLRGGEVEFALIGFVLNRLAEEYEETDRISAERLAGLYSLTEQDVSSVTEDGADPGSGGRRPGFQERT